MFQPVEMNIGNIPTTIVDPHHHLLPFWFRYLDPNNPAVLIHIDDHSDMVGTAPPADNEQEVRFLLEANSIPKISIGNFIIVARHANLIGPVYWIKPRAKKIMAYGRIHDNQFQNVQSTSIDSGRLKWTSGTVSTWLQEPVYLTQGEFRDDINGLERPWLSDCDLDGFHCRETPVVTRSGINSRVYRTLNLLAPLPKPVFNGVARSETPRRFTPKESVEYLQEKWVTGLKRLYVP